MRRYLGLFVGALCLCACIAAAPREEPDAGPSVEGLVARIDALEKRLAALEARASRDTLRMLPMQVIPDDAGAPPARPAPPKTWGQREFNGQPVYIVPLGQAEPAGNGQGRSPVKKASPISPTAEDIRPCE